MGQRQYVEPEGEEHEEVFADSGVQQVADDTAFLEINQKLDAIMAALNIEQEEQE